MITELQYYRHPVGEGWYCTTIRNGEVCAYVELRGDSLADARERLQALIKPETTIIYVEPI